MSISVKRLGGSFVGAVSGIDLSRPLDAAGWDAVHRAYLDHKVLVFRNQSLTAQSFAAFGAHFGEIAPHTIRKFSHPENPAVMILSNRTELGRPQGVRDAGSFWHSDWSYRQRTANATMLYALEVPDEGGDTLFGDLEAAYDALDPALKARLEGLRYRSQYRWTRDRDDPESMWRLLSAEEQAENPEVERPVVRTHPETGRKVVFVFPGISAGVKGIVGMDDSEAGALLDAVFEHMTDPRFQYRFKWDGPGTVLLWDNRCVMHKATTRDLPPEKARTLYRISTVGEVPH